MSLKKYLPYNVTFLMTQKSAKRGKFYDQNLLSILTWKKATVDALEILALILKSTFFKILCVH